ncbi:DUF58 domain-containing protein [Halomicroarcula sp. GCM10025324]|uniref:DUF58 domain-containing protein n=1 Tax=Haloarcula TaxID=2237 RepID=UPI0023E781C0|nr:DUF58 domain-containing protein [Halomicroarcula sp. ZS-22-S1]
MNYRDTAFVAGVVSLVLAGIAIVSPGTIPASPDRIVISALGVLPLLQALRVIRASALTRLDEAEFPTPELPVATQAPGEEFESALNQFLGLKNFYAVRSRIREGLSMAAIAALTQYSGYSEAEAREQLNAKSWTDDVYAGAFLADEDTPKQSISARLRNVARGEITLQRNIRHTVDAIAAVTGVTSSPDASTGTDQRSVDESESSPESSSTGFSASKPTGDGDGVVTRDIHPTGHWQGVSVIALVGIGAGMLVEQPAVLLAGVVGIAYAAFARSGALEPGRVTVERTLSDHRPDPGDTVAVSVTVSNESGGTLADLRIVDGVPEALEVTDGSPRFGTALSPESSATFEYEVTARRGVHDFGDTVVAGRDLAAELEQEQAHHFESTITCIPALRPLNVRVPLRDRATQYVGQVETAGGGPGVEFHSTRDYRSGDPLSRIDWNRRARTGELTTIDFREERSTSVLLLVDVREAAYRSAAPHTAHAVDRAVDAAGQVFATLVDTGNRVGIAAYGSDSCWLSPSSGAGHTAAAREMLATHDAFSPVPKESRPSSVPWENRLRKRLSAGTQVMFFSPLCDEHSAGLARRLDEYGYPVSIVTPDPTADRTPGHRLARIARALRLSRLRGAGIPVIDWETDTHLEGALARFIGRWSK